MSIDPDILAIQRRRRQEGRCLHCGRKVARFALCEGCRATLAYCPMCERLYSRRAGLDAKRATEYCASCGATYARERGGKRTYAQYIADVQAFRHRILPDLIRRYKKGEHLTKAGAALGLTRAETDRIIRDARKRGEWPDDLWRCRHRRGNKRD